ncbi:MAG: sulfatase-like hydrolase/transferase [bacterium]
MNRRCTLSGRCLASGAFFPLLFATVFAVRYGYSPLVVALHIAQVALVAILMVAMIGALRRAPVAIARTSIAIIGATLTSAYLLVIVLSTITNEAWGWSVSINLARAYLAYLPSIVGNLPVSSGLIALGIGLLVAVVIGIFWIWWVASPRFLDSRPPASRAAVIATVALAAVLVAFIAIARRSPDAAAEPLIALLTAPGQANAEQARAENVRARHEYTDHRAFSRRNVILIFSDALRADHMGVYGYQRQTTPFLSHLDSAGRLRKVRLAMATCPFTACGVLSTLASRDSAVLELGSLKLQDVLHDRGYRVNVIGSSDHTVWYTLRLHYGDNVDYFFDGFHSKRYSLNDDRLVLEGLDGVPPSTGNPAFFFFFLSATHPVGTKRAEFRRWVPAEVSVGTGAGVPQKNAYDNGILQADNSIEQIFTALDNKGYLKGSIVVMLGDHGDGFGEHGVFGHTRYLYQEMLHIPLLILDDSAGTYANLEFATQSDVAPTILARLGLSAPNQWQGQSLVDKPAKQFSTHWTDRGRPWHAVVYRTQGRIYKYMYVVRWGSRAEELYELTSDPDERTNLISTQGLNDIRAAVRWRAHKRWPTDGM